MEVEISGASEVTISGHIKSIEDYQQIKNTVKELVSGGRNSLVIRIPDSLSMTSSVIGFFLKLIYGDKVKVSMLVGDERLLNLLDVLNLLTVFDVKKI
ncbi:MAG: hypothetical protein K8I29_09745 [Alphaproteobacteria bacterium]|uniref:STAS domain-containing protein n=1 Tax=Candidatus Nitrobium versatile TaxID=2884831 RepID=A0A953JD16_9BACT|nr:hypothetical protein [Candidatus Nitrobium versatile]